ncbi:hypothetical protein [Micromonospora pisi]|uniref:hypothetical protein n=1 Tax=Micromonospora pisi TaxID=589240 RepID=UPI000EB0A2EC|nr:hypothetical protein [Micromonospora pisi]
MLNKSDNLRRHSRPFRREALLVVAGLATGCAGLPRMNSYSASPTAGVSYVLMAFVVVTFGVLGSIIAATLAGLLVGVAQALGGLYAPSYPLAVALVIVLVRPPGTTDTR